MDLISVIVPVYMVEAYLDQCVESIVHQSYSYLEIILVDDGSPDLCPQMCDKWAEKDDRIKVIHKTNGGLSDARNAGLGIATGDYIAFVDSDDWIDELFVEQLYREIKNSDVDICECAVTCINEEGDLLRNRSCDKTKVVYSRTEAIKALVKEDGVYQTVWNKLYRKKVIVGILFEVGKCHEDEFWTYQVFDRIDSLKVISKPLYFYRQRSGSIMGKGYQLKRLDGLEAKVRRMEYFRKENELYDFSKVYLQYDCLYHLQCSLYYLEGEAKKKAVNYILNCIRALGTVNYDNTGIPFKYRIWFYMFRKTPIEVAKIRNNLKIGI